VDDDDEARARAGRRSEKSGKTVQTAASRGHQEVQPVAVTKSWEAKVLAVGSESGAPHRIGLREFVWLAGASLLVSIGLALVYSAKTQNFAELSSRLNRGELLDLNSVTKPEQLLPFLQIFPGEAEREAVANKTFDFPIERTDPSGTWAHWPACV
jgi:hypothetical protein